MISDRDKEQNKGKNMVNRQNERDINQKLLN
jgi:hypothetical protein